MGDLITVGDQSVLGDLKQLAKAIQDLGWSSAGGVELGMRTEPVAVDRYSGFLLDVEFMNTSRISQYIHFVTPFKKEHGSKLLWKSSFFIENSQETLPAGSTEPDMVWTDASTADSWVVFDKQQNSGGYITDGDSARTSTLSTFYFGSYFLNDGRLVRTIRMTSSWARVSGEYDFHLYDSTYAHTKNDFSVFVSDQESFTVLP